MLNINVIWECTCRQSKITENAYVTFSFNKILILKILKILGEYLFKYLDDNLEALQIYFSNMNFTTLVYCQRDNLFKIDVLTKIISCYSVIHTQKKITMLIIW